MEFVVITLLGFFIELALVYSISTSSNEKEKLFFWLFSIQAFTLFAFRDVNVLPDTMGYYYHFNDVKNTPFFDIDIYDRFGIGYLYYEKFIHNYISDHFLVFNVISTAITMIPVLNYFKNNSTCIWFTFLLFITSRLIFSEAIALRQGLAFGVCMMGVEFLSNDRKQLLKYLPFIAIAVTIHSSAIVFLILFLIHFFNREDNKMVVIYMLAIFSMIFVNFGFILETYYVDSDDSRYLTVASESGYFNMVGMYSSFIALVIFFYIYRMRKLCYIDTYDNLYIVTIFFVLASLLSIRLFVITRFLMYLYPFVIIYATQLYYLGKEYGIGLIFSRIFIVLMIINYLYIIYMRPEWVFDNEYKFWTNDFSRYSII